ncbi:MAG: gamma-butyrobetaine hydroxylase-like domain-containing protein [Tepidisphaeraceae bacterium]
MRVLVVRGESCIGLRGSSPCPVDKMSRIEKHELKEGAGVEITAARRTGGYELRLNFSDGHESEIDFEPFLRQSQHLGIRAFLDPARFAKFAIEDGGLVWGDYELCFPLTDLYSGKI